MQRLLATLCLIATFLAAHTLPLAAQGAEEITLFESRISVDEDGALTVTELITVNAQHIQVKRGIYRDFPTRYYDEDNGLLETRPFEVLSVKRDGVDEPYHTQSMGGGVRIYIGNENFFVSRGIHTYELTYRTERQLRHFEDFDEVYWNVTGNAWAFPIRLARARVTLPPDAEVLQWAAYTGPRGSTERDAEVIAQSGRAITIETTRRLSSGEGLTVAVAFPKGFVPDVTPNQALFRKIWDNLGLFTFLAAVPLIFGYLLHHWARVGRDPPRRAVIPRFGAPRGLSPGAVSYLYFRGFRKGFRSGASKAFVAALTALAVKGRIIIDETGKHMKVKSRPGSRQPMTDDERALSNALLGQLSEREFKKENAKTIRNAITRFRSAIERSYADVYYTTNRRYVIVAFIMLVFAAVFFLIVDRPPETVLIPTIFAMAFGGVGLTIFSVALTRILGIAGEGSLTGAIFMLLFSIPFATVPLLMVLLTPGGWVTLVPLLAYLTIAAIVTFAYLMPAPTEDGQRLAEEIEGYRLYLSVAEAERMNMAGAPRITPQVYETHLPFAIGLGVEKQWSHAFEEALTEAGKTDRTYRPGFYRGNAWNAGTLSRAAGGMAAAIGSSIASATPAPSSSSGSGGGGFSGGGGGGGGGGGW
ncbi:DUF2207 domain-containing protein [Tepidamorphus sp. 3E244]|uniref:DUF2207 domain-containing protein n=1 Tax=Tepidamorphus sp. 3E244 TaxID=3385498 RepID=UPI0038FCAC42